MPGSMRRCIVIWMKKRVNQTADRNRYSCSVIMTMERWKSDLCSDLVCRSIFFSLFKPTWRRKIVIWVQQDGKQAPASACRNWFSLNVFCFFMFPLSHSFFVSFQLLVSYVRHRFCCSFVSFQFKEMRSSVRWKRAPVIILGKIHPAWVGKGCRNACASRAEAGCEYQFTRSAAAATGTGTFFAAKIYYPFCAVSHDSRHIGCRSRAGIQFSMSSRFALTQSGGGKVDAGDSTSRKERSGTNMHVSRSERKSLTDTSLPICSKSSHPQEEREIEMASKRQNELLISLTRWMSMAFATRWEEEEGEKDEDTFASPFLA